MRKTTRLGRYHLTERIAFGGMAEIYRGFTFANDGFRRDIAIKKLLPHYAEDEHFIEMLTEEYKLVSYLRHANVAEVFELSEVGGNVLIAMEYVDGKDLRSCIDKARRLGIGFGFDDIAYVLARALNGLHHAHTARDATGEPLGIVHRDFSPSNVILAYDGRVKICDFGIAKAQQSSVQTKTGIIKGKVRYMSPEQAFGRKLDARSDLFSAGSVLYELCAGTPPFKAKNEIDLIFAVRDAAPPPIREIKPEVPEALAEIIERSMRRGRSNRYQSALEFRDALIDYLRVASPKYRRTRLGRTMKKVWAKEIDVDLRALEEFVLDLQPPEASRSYGRNLIAEALGPNAEYSRFSANPTFTGASPAGGGQQETVDDRRDVLNDGTPAIDPHSGRPGDD